MIIIRSLVVIPITIIMLLSSCAYEKMNSPDRKKFHITEINSNGERRAAFIIQKKINRFSNEQSTNKIKIFIDLTKSKEIQEKNMQNKVTKYNVSLSAKIVITELLSTKEFKRLFSTSEIYDVADRYTDTVNNEKNAHNALVNKVVDEILEQLRILYN